MGDDLLALLHLLEFFRWIDRSMGRRLALLALGAIVLLIVAFTSVILLVVIFSR